MSNLYNNQPWNTHPPATNNTRTISDPPSNPNPPQQYGALALNAAPHPPRSVVTAASVSHGQALSQRPPISPTAPTASNSIGSASYDHYRAYQVVPLPPNASRPAEGRSLAGLGYHLSAPEIQNWAPTNNGGNINEGHPPLTLSQGQSQGHNNNTLNRPSRPPQRPSQRSPPPPSSGHDGDSSQKNCIIPGCPYPAYYNYADQEQTEYCGQGHELQAIATGLVDTCVMCKGRPRHTGENVCGRTCRERVREAHQVQGNYYGVQVTRYEAQTRSGA